MTDRFEGFADQLLNGRISLGEATSLLERSMIHAALGRNGNNQSAAARLLGVHRNTLQRKMVEFGMDAARPRARRKPVSRAGHSRGKKSKLA